jgi:hypothetical protein
MYRRRQEVLIQIGVLSCREGDLLASKEAVARIVTPAYIPL